MNASPIIAESNRGSFSGLDEPGPRITNGSVAPGSLSIPLIVQSAGPASAQRPVTVGVPFPRGVLGDDASLSLLDSLGKPVPLQLNPLARWSDGSVKWMLLDFILGPVVAGQSVWSLQVRHGEPREVSHPREPLSVAETDRTVVVHTGSATFTLDRQILAPLAQVEIENTPVLDEGNSRTVLVDAKGRSCYPQIERYELEANGPVRATVLFEGTIKGRRRQRYRFQARLSFFSGLSLVRIELTLHNPRRARHRGGLWDLGDPGSLFVRDLSLQLALAGPGARQVQWTENVDDRLKSAECERFEIYQDSSGGENWQSPNHVNRQGRSHARFRGYRVRQDGMESYSLRASPLVTLRGDDRWLTAGMPEFWQQFPKAIDVEDGRLSVRPFPGQSGELHELQGGEQKTHTIWLEFGSRSPAVTDSLGWINRPARVHCSPAWYADSQAIPQFPLASTTRDERFETYISAVIDGPNNLLARRELIDEYGWRHYGEIYADHENEYYTGVKPVVSHYNNQYDLVQGTLLQCLRTSDTRWFELGDTLARHVIDIDSYHTTQDRTAYNGGLFWHTDHYRDAATSTHRCYSRANRGSAGRNYGGGPCNEHNYTTGLLHYYYLTGNPQARDTVLGLADWVIAMDDGRRTVFGLIDAGATGSASSTTEPGYHGPGRGCGNSVNALLDAWLLTCDRGYLDKAEQLIRRVVHPATNIAELDLLNVERRWSYTVFLTVLARYLSLKLEHGEQDQMYDYAQSSLTHFAGWMAGNEVPYFDHPEKLEFPTEAWAAHELRKANVLRLAAAHVDEPLRSLWFSRGNELAERAWSDLLRFESRHSARAVAIMLQEGLRDTRFRGCTIASQLRSSGAADHGTPESFVPQKRRVLAQFKTPHGLAGVLGKVLSPRNWGRFLADYRGDRKTIGGSSKGVPRGF